MTIFTTTVRAFGDLTPFELYDILRLRSEVFVVEQNCVFLDQDNKDQHCMHVMMRNGQDALAAYARLLPPGLAYPEMSIGRIISSNTYRGTGLGRTLVEESIRLCYKNFGKLAIRIGAQVYARAFYEKLGFVQHGNEYDEDGIPHIEMIRQPDKGE